MGGNAFPEHLNRITRLVANDYCNFENYIVEKLNSQYKNLAVFKKIPSYYLKQDFGDLDIVYTDVNGPQQLPDPKDIAEYLDSEGIVRNGPVTSCAVPINFENRLFQVDLIYVPNVCFDFARSYFSYNDLGNIIGRIFHRAGFKLGQQGLVYVVRDEDNASHMLAEIPLTYSWANALEFAGYDYNVWLKGFDTLEDVFKYAVSNPLASRSIFRLDEMSHAARVRDRKRSTYQKFLKWVNDPTNNIPVDDVIPKSQLRELWLQRAFEFNPRFEERYSQLQESVANAKLAKQYFNGLIVRRITGLEGKKLGEFIQKFKTDVIQQQFNLDTVSWALTVKDLSNGLIKQYFESHSTN